MVLRQQRVKLPSGGQANWGSGTILGGLICPQQQQVAFWEEQDEGQFLQGKSDSLCGSKQQVWPDDRFKNNILNSIRRWSQICLILLTGPISSFLNIKKLTRFVGLFYSSVVFSGTPTIISTDYFMSSTTQKDTTDLRTLITTDRRNQSEAESWVQVLPAAARLFLHLDVKFDKLGTKMFDS